MKRTKPIARRTPIKRVSDKRRREIRAYSLLREAFLVAHPYCGIWLKRHGFTEADIVDGHVEIVGALWPVPWATDIHHKAKRGVNYLNVDTWIAASRSEHAWVHDHPGEARKLGLLV